MNCLASGPQETAKALQYAALAKRLKAFAFDYLVILGYIALLAAATLAVVKTAGLLGLTISNRHGRVRAGLCYGWSLCRFCAAHEKTPYSL